MRVLWLVAAVFAVLAVFGLIVSLTQAGLIALACWCLGNSGVVPG